ncbi:MAG: 3-oxoadipate enol-lactonase [Pseudomonadota bacterium]
MPNLTPSRLAVLGNVSLHYRIDGDPDGAPLVFSNSLSTDLRVWDAVVERLPPGLCIIRYDTRGHGLSACPEPPYTMGALVSDLEALLDHLDVREVALVGLSIGGMIAQGLAAKRLDQVRAAILSNTGAKIATRTVWQNRIDAARNGGLAALVDPTFERWFPEPFRSSPQADLMRHMFLRQPLEGWIGCASAISGTDFYTPTAALRLPVLGIAGDRDGSTPPDLVRETIELVPGARFHLIKGTGHLPCVDAPDAYAAALTGFLAEIGHI